jgi:MerR family transcriptional regulator, light-induced transcriptional regulator
VTSALLDLQAAADRLGVHYQTVYRWVRNGTLPALMINGRYALECDVVDDFGRQRTTPVPAAPRRTRTDLARQADAMHVALMSGDDRAARQLIDALISRGITLTELMDQVVAPALRRIGADWHAGLVSIWVEHRATAIASALISAHLPNPRGRRRGHAVVAAVSGDVHVLATMMAAAALRDDNWHVQHLGADMPTYEVLDFVSTHPMDLAVITVSMPDVEHDALALARDLEGRGVRTLVGAPGRTLADLITLARG